MKRFAGRRFYLMQAKAEVGNRSIVQIAPTVQFTPGNYTGNNRLSKPFLYDEFFKISGRHVVTGNCPTVQP